MTAASGKTYADFVGEGNFCSWSGNTARDCRVRLDIGTVAGSLKAGNLLTMLETTTANGDCNLTFYYLKHGTTNAAKANLFGQVYDIDKVYNLTSYDSNSAFDGKEGLIFYNASLYLDSSPNLKTNASEGQVWCPTHKNTNGKDWSSGVAFAFSSSTATITFAAASNVDLYFDYQKAPSAPSKSAKITS